MKKLKPACQVRWYSTVTMLDNLLNLKTVILEDVLPCLGDDRVNLIRDLNWTHLEEVLSILKPLNECIGVLERKEMSLGGAVKTILNYAKELFAEVDRPSSTLVAARCSFLWHFNPKRIGREEFGLFVAAYALNRGHNLNYITEDGVDLLLDTIIRIAARSGATLSMVSSSLIEEFEVYRNFLDDYAILDDGNSAKWWTNRLGSGLLAKVAIRLANLKASSTNIERTFSTLKGIQGGSRSNLSISSLIDICRVKINASVIFDEYVSEDLMNTDECEQSHSSQDLNSSNESLNSSEITEPMTQTHIGWLDDQDPEVIISYKNFFRFIDFSKEEECNFRDDGHTDPVLEDDIKRLVSAARALRERKSCGATLDNASQIFAYDGILIDE